MAYDSNVHDFDASTGFMVEKDTGVPVGLVARPPAKTVEHVKDWPKWVDVHESHVEKGENDRVTGVKGGWSHSHVGRDGKAAVLVANEDQEKRATSEFSDEEDGGLDTIDPAIRAQVAAEFDRAEAEKLAMEAQERAKERNRIIDEEAAKRSKDYHEAIAQRRQEASDKAKESRARLDEATGGPSEEERRAALGEQEMPVGSSVAGHAEVHPYDRGIISERDNKVIETGPGDNAGHAPGAAPSQGAAPGAGVGSRTAAGPGADAGGEGDAADQAEFKQWKANRESPSRDRSADEKGM